MGKAIRWPLPRWARSVGVSSSTHRAAYLSGGSRPNNTNLGSLRKFVASLEQWPDDAQVEKADGAVLCVEFFSSADPLLGSEPTP